MSKKEYYIKSQIVYDENEHFYYVPVEIIKGHLDGNEIVYKKDNQEVRINVNLDEDFVYDYLNMDFLRKYYSLDRDNKVVKVLNEMIGSIVGKPDADGNVFFIDIDTQDFVFFDELSLSDSMTFPPLAELEKDINSYILGQEDAVRSILISIYAHYLDGKKMPIMLHGSTGTGKTEIFKLLSTRLGLPFLKVELSNFSATGYVGDNIKDIPTLLYSNANKKLGIAENSIVFFDEIDKILATSKGYGKEAEVNKGDVVNAILSFISGAKYPLAVSSLHEDEENENMMFDTNNLYIAFAGAFTELRDSKKKNKRIGFDVVSTLGSNNLTHEDFTDYGVSSEFLGRVKMYVGLNDLDKELLRKILVDSKLSPIREFIEIFKKTGKNIVITDDIIDFIADKAYSYKNGARSLDLVTTRLFADLLYQKYNGLLPEGENLFLEVECNEDNYKLVIISKNKVRERKNENKGL